VGADALKRRRREMKLQRKKKTNPFIHTDGYVRFGADNQCGSFVNPAVVKFSVSLHCYAPNTEYSVDGTFSKQMYKALDSAMKNAARRANLQRSIRRRGGNGNSAEMLASRYFSQRGIHPTLSEFREVRACMINGSNPEGIH
jgi:hypothetical protein